MRFPSPTAVMQHALELAQRGEGRVEPNPMVGAVVVDDELTLLGAGWHQQFGGPHAEVHALAEAGVSARQATLFVTLEPCCHFGKTPPCTQAVIQSGVRRVVIAVTDPNPQVAGQGIAELTAAGILVETGLLEAEAKRLIAPFRKLMTQDWPWVIGKWAMTLDGKLASRTGDSRWISGDESRKQVHALRGRMDAMLVGIGTVLSDDPLLTARPAGPRTPLRVVVDTQARLPMGSQLARTARQIPVLLAVGEQTSPTRVRDLTEAGIEVLRLPVAADGHVSLPGLLDELGRRRCTNLLVEGGSQVLGACFDQFLLDEVYAFVAPKLLGGLTASSPLAGIGRETMSHAGGFSQGCWQQLGDDILFHGRLD